jgi:uncharacterized RDD family membrane protein YckC
MREPPRAGFATRALAMLLDVLVVDAAAVVAAVGIALTARLLGADLRAGDPTLVVLAGVGWLVAFGGYLLTFWILTGQTLGMRVMGIRVVDHEGGRLRPVRAAVRLGGTALCILTWGVGFLLVLVDDRRRGLQDVLAGTAVVRDRDLGAPSAVAPVPRHVRQA